MPLHRFIVPVRGVSTFCTVLDGRLQAENPLPQVGHGEHALDPEFGWVAWPSDGGKAIGRAHLDATDGEGGFAPLPLPGGYTAECLLFHRQVLFVGGDCGKEVLGAFDFASPTPRWVPLPVPEEFRQYGKRIDDLLLDGDRLIAVDDIVSPKYLLRYDVTDPRAPELAEVREIPAHSSYETIHAGAVGTDWMALFSTSMNHGWHGLHVALFDRPTLTERANLNGTAQRSGRQPEGLTSWDWRGVAFHGNTLLIASGTDGVGVLNLDGVPDPPTEGLSALDGPWGTTVEAHQFAERCQAALRYEPLPGACVRVVPVPDTRHYLAVIETPDGLDTVVRELA